jgi:hypothetical protein
MFAFRRVRPAEKTEFAFCFNLHYTASRMHSFSIIHYSSLYHPGHKCPGNSRSQSYHTAKRRPQLFRTYGLG